MGSFLPRTVELIFIDKRLDSWDLELMRSFEPFPYFGTLFCFLLLSICRNQNE
jgi:hypothetical protein